MKNQTDSENYNYGLAILRIWMCFEVVLDHFMSWNTSNKYEIKQPMRLLFEYGGVAVPVFMIIAFVFTDIEAVSKDKSKIAKRLKRLLVPYCFWNIAYYVVYYIIEHVNTEITLTHGISDLAWQFLFGSAINATLWFQTEIIVITALYILIYRVFAKKTANMIVTGTAVIAIVLQYTGMHSKLCLVQFPATLFGCYFDSQYFIYTVVRFFEVLPMAAIGVFIFQRGFLGDRSIKTRIVLLFCLVATLRILLNTEFFVMPYGLGYQGLQVIAIAVVSIFLFFYLPLSWIPKWAKSLIKLIASTTMATYYIHRMVGTIIYNSALEKSLNMTKGSFYDCVIIFGMCITMSLILRNIPIGFVKKSFE